ncbi:MAG TPA: nucleoside monophosphate kinase [Acidimicrobiales bacterium]|nr:nucleoside monophosphate kinase [Acidimicrobiales bacterium]
MRVVLVGAPGSGKSTQGPALAAHLGVPYLATGDLLRQAAESGSSLGRRVAEVVERGELVPDDVVVAVLAAALGDDATGYVLDGFPRTVAQAEALDAGSTPLAPPDLVAHLDVDEAVLRRRLTRRAQAAERADDTDPEVVEKRLRVYREETRPLLDHYRRRGRLVVVGGDGPPDEVGRQLRAAVAGAAGRQLPPGGTGAPAH